MAAKKKAASKKKSTKAKNPVEAQLAGMKAAFAKADIASGGNDLPEGTYQGTFGACSVGLSKAKKLQAVFPITVGAGDHEGKTITKFASLDKARPDSLSYFKRDLQSIGIEDPDDPSEIPSIVSELEGSAVQFRVVHNGTFTNIYFDCALDEIEEEENEDVEFEDMDDEDLLEFCDENDIELTKKEKKLKGKKLRKLVESKWDEDDDEEDEDDEDSDSEEDEEDDSDEEDSEDEEPLFTEAEIAKHKKKLAKLDGFRAVSKYAKTKLEMDMTGTKGMPLDDLMAKIEEHLGVEPEEEDEEGDDEEEPDFEEMSKKELQTYAIGTLGMSKKKVKKMSEEKLRDAIDEELDEDEDED